LSPLLFILAIDPLQRLLNLVTEAGILSKVARDRARMRISLYVDDAVIFLRPDKQEVKALVRLLNLFGQVLRPRNPSFITACALDPGVDATAAARSELRSRLPFTAIHRTVHRPQHLHGSSPSTLDARVTAIQRPSARSHRTVDNSLITSRIEYSRSSPFMLFSL